MSEKDEELKEPQSQEEPKAPEGESEQPGGDKDVDQSTGAESKEEAKEEAAEAFAAGFNKVRGDKEPKLEKKAKAPEQEKPKAKEGGEEPPPQPKPKPTEDPLAKATERISRLEGHIGSLLQRLNSMTAAQRKSVASQQRTTAKEGNDGNAPTQSQIRAALRNDAKLKDLIEEFPSFEPVLSELKAIREDMQHSSVPDSKALIEQATSSVLYEIENTNLVKTHPNWTADVRSDAFRNWALQGGPSATEFAGLQATSQYDQARTDQILQTWQISYPDWWKEKGQAMFSSRPSDTHRMMDAYKAHINQTVSAASHQRSQIQQRNQQRLERSMAPQGTPDAPTAGISDSEAFARGFNKVRGLSR